MFKVFSGNTLLISENVKFSVSQRQKVGGETGQHSRDGRVTCLPVAVTNQTRMSIVGAGEGLAACSASNFIYPTHKWPITTAVYVKFTTSVGI